jgi:TonB family protein
MTTFMSMTKLRIGITSALVVAGATGFVLQAETLRLSDEGVALNGRLQQVAKADEVRRAADASVGVYDISKLDQAPRAKFQARPQYPRELREAGISGQVVVDFIVDKDGNVQNAYAAKSSQKEFEASAVDAVSQWKFSPGRKDGRDVNTHMQVPIVFSLNNKKDAPGSPKPDGK